MVPYMRVGGKTVNQTGRGERSMQTEMSIMAIGRMVSLMDLASTPHKTDTNMKETGKNTKGTVRALLPGLMV
jgi:hypothetical protein